MRQVMDLRQELALAGIIRERQTISEALRLVARMHGLTVGVLRGPRKDKYAARARRDAYAALMHLQLSSADVGRILGNRDHSSVLAGIKKRNAEIAAGRPLTSKEVQP